MTAADKTPANKAPDDIDIHVGARVRMRRREMGLSQQQLADVTGVSFQQVQKYEKGTNRLSASRLVQVARTLDVPVSWFFEELEFPETLEGHRGSVWSAALKQISGRPGGLELARNLPFLTDAELSIFAALTTTLAKANGRIVRAKAA